MTAVGFVLAAAIGTLLRAVATGFDTEFTRRMAATATVNTLGSFVLGLLVGADADAMLIVGVGGLGAFTTFSTMISETECIQRERSSAAASLHLVGSVVVTVAAAGAGLAIGD